MENIFPFLIPLAIIMIPIVAILTKHQREMAELMVEQHRTLLELENRKMQTQAPAPLDVNTQYELQTLRDRLAQMEAKLAESGNHQRISS